VIDRNPVEVSVQNAAVVTATASLSAHFESRPPAANASGPNGQFTQWNQRVRRSDGSDAYAFVKNERSDGKRSMLNALESIALQQ
jgi:hypothetical protein